MKLSEYAKKNSITYRTAQNHWKLGLIKGKQLPTGTIVVFDDEQQSIYSNQVILYARVSSSENKNNLENQLKRLRDYAAAKGYKIIKEVKEIGSGLNDKRPLLQSLFEKDDWSKIIVEHKDRLARFGINYIQILLKKLNKEIEIINDIDNDKEDILQDLVSIITSFTARIYGLRRSKRKTEIIIKTLKNETN
ncbi:MAG: IS607 family transposase [Nanoarchaeota archaeon]|nr:IS607 family transposase [Nanoarchaeota archaeon]